ncbi:hypothetical protein P7K49_017239 [Saguinus oedipus]|uniref:Uncharacterized protein n=1 Tax=Saguinus oedipus TaxID=9490 RepID=A0ABQ9V1X1_SAGOE|nr:hypothetical protein P7K49_017239 [Saguinus oedipus]
MSTWEPSSPSQKKVWCYRQGNRGRVVRPESGLRQRRNLQTQSCPYLPCDLLSVGEGSVVSLGLLKKGERQMGHVGLRPTLTLTPQGPACSPGRSSPNSSSISGRRCPAARNVGKKVLEYRNQGSQRSPLSPSPTALRASRQPHLPTACCNSSRPTSEHIFPNSCRKKFWPCKNCLTMASPLGRFPSWSEGSGRQHRSAPDGEQRRSGQPNPAGEARAALTRQLQPDLRKCPSFRPDCPSASGGAQD